ncbi:MAG: hypothetical protein QOK07_766 [Gemmatimonadaceae bacterium]|jgi:hypothetical protein|nr:hypothetical protein [Gemmatimonadaceae bacterium]
MLKHSLMLAAVTTLLAACGAENPTAPSAVRLSPSSARPAAHADPGTPGSANCRGQTEAYAAQLGKAEGIPGANGIGGVARTLGLSVKDIQGELVAFCAEEI